METQSPFDIGSKLYGMTVEFYKGGKCLFQVDTLENFIEEPPQVLRAAAGKLLPLQNDYGSTKDIATIE